MKFLTLTLVTLFALTSQAGGPKREGLLKNPGEVALIMESQFGTTTTFMLGGKQKKLPILLSAPTMKVNGAVVTTKLLKVDTQQSNHKYELTGTDVAGTPVRIVDKKMTMITFTADLSQVAKADKYLVEVVLTDKISGSVEVPSLNQ